MPQEAENVAKLKTNNFPSFPRCSTIYMNVIQRQQSVHIPLKNAENVHLWSLPDWRYGFTDSPGNIHTNHISDPPGGDYDRLLGRVIW
jgi:hypothetical protein